MDQSEFTLITCNLLKAPGKSRVQGAIGFGFALIGWKTGTRLKPITKGNICNHVISFKSHLKIALFIWKSTPKEL
mgnify:CR=1 FL=1